LSPGLADAAEAAAAAGCSSILGGVRLSCFFFYKIGPGQRDRSSFPNPVAFFGFGRGRWNFKKNQKNP
jgi:hypothetical protein